ncbi:MAG: hypothetical protein LBI74_04650 [Synergistaceae bacterium]|jgi:hypothetical protein|nr:hypothetical protein [Synergistaceae bacterium]
METKFRIYGVRGEVSFDLDDAELDDGSYVFYGYWTGPETAEIWGREVDFRAIVETEGYGTRINVLEDPESKDGSVAWFENRLELMREVEFAARCLKEEIGDRFPEMSEQFAAEIRGYYDAEGFLRLADELAAVVDGRALTLGQQVERLIPIFNGLQTIVSEAGIPQSMKLEGSPFNAALLEMSSRLLELRAHAEEAAAQGKDVPEEFFSSIDRAIDAMKASSSEHEEESGRREASRPRLSEPEQSRINLLEGELRRPDTRDCRRIEIWRELYGNRSVSFERRIDYLESLSNLLTVASERVNESIRDARGRYGAQPPMGRYVEEINVMMRELDRSGFAFLADALAEEFFEEVSLWRSNAGLPRISIGRLAETLRPASVCVSVINRNGDCGPLSRAEIYVKETEGFFDGRVMYISVNGSGGINSMSVMDR